MSTQRRRSEKIPNGASRKHVAAAGARASLPSAALCAVISVLTEPAQAGPENGVIVRGAATISSADGVTDIQQSSTRAIIDWRSFSVGAHEHVRFQQPSTDSATLNRVRGAQQSVIDGALSANGHVFILNPSGVLFGRNARVDVGGLVATTSAIGNDDFMEDRLEFRAAAQPGVAIENHGRISAREGGIAALVAPSVRNEGVIEARLGRIALAGGEAFTLDLYGDRLIQFSLQSEPSAGIHRVDQSGTVAADGGRILLTADAAGSVVSGVVNMSGVAQARSISRTTAGEIVLEAADGVAEVDGTLDVAGVAPGTTGGRIDVFARDVNLQASARLDASGVAGGGVIRVGGGASGEQSPRALTATVAPGAQIDASATADGHGGRVTVWGDARVEFAGEVAARGGAERGDGGFVEVSTAQLMQFLGHVFVDAPRGAHGVLLLDPPEITIEPDGDADITGSVVSGPHLRAILRSGANVILTADNRITVNDILDGRAFAGSTSVPSGQVQLTAGAIIVARPIITERNTISLNATASDITFRGDAFLYVADSTATSGTGTAGLTLSAAGAVAINSLTNPPSDPAAAAQLGQLVSLGPVTITASAGDVSLPGLFGLQTASGPTGVGSLTVSAGGEITMAGVSSNGSVALTGSRVANSDASIIAQGDVVVRAGAGGIEFAALAGDAAGIDARGAGAVSLQTPGVVLLNSGIRTAQGDITLGDIDPATADARIGSLTAGPVAALQTGGDGDIAVYAAGALDFRGAASGGAVTLNTEGRLSNLDRSIEARGAVTLAAGGDPDEGIHLQAIRAGDGNLRAAVEAGAGASVETSGDVVLTSGVRTNGGDIHIGAADARVGSLELGAGAALETAVTGAASGDISIFATGDVAAQSDDPSAAAERRVLAGGAVTVDSSNGDINLDGMFGLGDEANRTGVGALTVNAGGDVSLRGAQASGAISITGRSVTNALASIIASGDVSLMAGAGGITLSDGAAGIDASGARSVSLLTSGAVTLNDGVSTENGAITIGSSSAPASAVTMGPGAALAVATSESGPQTGAISIRSSGAVSVNDIVGGTQAAVEIRGSSVSVAGTINSVAADQGVGSVDIVADSSVQVRGIRVSDALFQSGDDSALLSLVVAEGGSIAIRGPISSGGHVFIGQRESHNAGNRAASNAQLDLAHNIFTRGRNVDINADITLFVGISRWDVERVLSGEDTSTLDPVLFTAAPYPGQDDFQRFSGPSGMAPEAHASYCNPANSCGVVEEDGIEYLEIPNVQQVRFFTNNSIARDDAGAALAEFNDLSCGGFICGYERESDPEGTAPYIELAEQRANRWARMLGGLSVAISTTDRGALPNSTGRITIDGDVGRYIGAPRPAGADESDIHTSDLNHALILQSGAGAIDITGALGDAVREDSVFRSFAVELDAQTISVGSELTAAAGTFVNRLCRQGVCILPEDPPPSPPDRLPVVVDAGRPGGLFPDTELGVGSFEGGDVAPPNVGAGPTFVPSPGSASASTTVLPGAPGPGVTGVGIAAPPPPVPTRTDLPTSADDAELSVAEDTFRLEPEEQARSQSDGDESDNEDRCPRGAPALADVGTARGVSGSPPDVYRRCRETQQ